MIDKAIERLADRVLAFDEADLLALLHHFKNRMEEFEPTPAWERAVIAYFLINGVRVKNVLKHGHLHRGQVSPSERPGLKLVKA
jgi:hypothetical protein